MRLNSIRIQEGCDKKTATMQRQPSKAHFTDVNVPVAPQSGRQLFHRNSIARARTERLVRLYSCTHERILKYAYILYRIQTYTNTTRLVLGANISFALTMYVDVETGDTVTHTTNKFLDPKRYRKLENKDGALAGASHDIEKGVSISNIDASTMSKVLTVKNLNAYNEVASMGLSWRSALMTIILASKDEVNALRFTRPLQNFMPMLTGYEAYLLDQVICSFERDNSRDLAYVLTLAFRNRNVSRILVQQMARYDILWHQNQQFTWNRWFDAFGTVPFVGITGFPGTENFLNTRNHTLGSIFRRVLGQGFWWTRVITGRQALVTDDENTVAQNLAAESNGFETANRNQHGTWLGREKTNAFRKQHRLPTDESIVRTFIRAPLPTMLNNGVEHTITQLARHYRNMIYQPYGNFAHQRMEQLSPFELLRFHMPVILVGLTTLRGINHWDAEVLGPFVAKLQVQ
jgi:hypothetical protein